MQSFIDRRAVLSLKKRQTVSHNPPGAPPTEAANAVASSGSSSKQDQLIFGTGSNNKSITQPNSPRAAKEEVVALNEKLILIQQQPVNKIVLPKGIIRFSNNSTKRGNSMGSKSSEKRQSHEPREESLRRKKKVMQIIRNFEKGEHSHPPKIQGFFPPEPPKPQQVLLKSKVVVKQPEDVDPLLTKNGAELAKSQTKSKIVVHRRINKTFAANTPE